MNLMKPNKNKTMGNQWSTFIETPETPFFKAVVMLKGLGVRIAVLDFEGLFLPADYQPFPMTQFNQDHKQAAIDDLVSHLSVTAVEFTRALLTHGIGVTLTTTSSSKHNGNAQKDQTYHFGGQPWLEEALTHTYGADVTRFIEIVEVQPKTYWKELKGVIQRSRFPPTATLLVHQNSDVIHTARRKHHMLAMLSNDPLFQH